MTKYKTPKTEDLFEAGVHIGHQAKRWHPKMEPFIYSTENKVHVFDLEQTSDRLSKACEFLFEVAKKGGQIIFVGSKRQASTPVKEAALKSGALYVTERWLGGTVTNFRMIKKNVDKLVNYLKKREDGSLQKYTKKERLMIDREIEKLEKYVGGIVPLKGTPQAMVVIDPRKEKTAVREAVRAEIPIVALIDSNSDPTLVNYPIPGNDDAIKSITLIINTLADAVEEGYKESVRLADKVKADADKAKADLDAAKEPAPLIVTSDAADEIIVAEEEKLTKTKIEPVTITKELKGKKAEPEAKKVKK